MLQHVLSTPGKLFALVLALHHLADYNLQGALCHLKQESFWRKACRECEWCSETVAFRKYGRDYRAGLACHALYWTLVTYAPLIFHPLTPSAFAWGLIIANSAFHYWVDDLKANRWRINLVQDQLLHLAQICVTFAVWLQCVWRI